MAVIVSTIYELLYIITLHIYSYLILTTLQDKFNMVNNHYAEEEIN